MEVKGAAVHTLPDFIRKDHGDDGLARWLAALPEGTRALYGRPILASSWYPLRPMLVEPTRILCDLFYGGDVRGAHDSGRHSAESGLHGIYKVFVQIGSPSSLVRKASSILPKFYRPSAMEVVESQKTSAVVRLAPFEEPDAIVDARIAGWMERALEISGCHAVEVAIPRSLARGDAYTEFKLAWK